MGFKCEQREKNTIQSFSKYFTNNLFFIDVVAIYFYIRGLNTAKVSNNELKVAKSNFASFSTGTADKHRDCRKVRAVQLTSSWCCRQASRSWPIRCLGVFKGRAPQGDKR